MMTCQQVDDEMGALLDGELPPALGQEVASHLASCPSCRGQRDELARVRRDVESLPSPPLPEDFNARVLEALARRQARPGWRDRLDRGLDVLTGLLLGTPGTAPLTPGAFARSALASGAAVAAFATASAFLLANTILCEFYGNVGMMARTVHDVVRHYPMVPDLASRPWNVVCLLGALQVLLFVGGLRALDLRGFWHSVRAREPMTIASVGPVLVAAFLLAVLGYTTLQAVGACAVLTGQGSPWHLAGSVVPWVIRGLVIVQGVLSLGLVVKRCHLGLGSLSLCFYATLLLGYLAETSFTLAWTGPFEILTTSQQEGYMLALMPPERMNAFLFVYVPLAGFAVGALFAALAYRRLPARAVLLRYLAPAAVVAGLCLLPLVAFGLRVAADSRTLHGQGVPLAQQAGLTPDDGRPRTVVVLAGPTLGTRTAAFNLPGPLSEANVARLRAFIQKHPRSLAAPEAHRMVIMSARMQWDEPAMWKAVFDLGTSGQTGFWLGIVIWRLGAAPPHARYRAILDRIGSDEFVIVSSGWFYRALGRAFLRHGNVRAADRYFAMDHAPGNQRGANDPPRLTTGIVRGRILTGQTPVVGVPVRLVGLREVRSEGNLADDTLMWRAIASIQEDERLFRERGERVDTLARCFTATRTDAQGRFRFAGLADDRYVLLLLLDGTVEEVARRSSGIRQGVVVVSPEHPTIDIGDIHLGDGR